MVDAFFLLPEMLEWQTEEVTPKLRWLDGTLQQAWRVSGPDWTREEWRDVPTVQSPQVTTS